MTKAAYQTPAEAQDEAKPASQDVSHYIPLKKLASHVLIKSYCEDCSTERTRSASQFLTAGVSPFVTVATLNQSEKCDRKGCGGDLRFSIDLGGD